MRRRRRRTRGYREIVAAELNLLPLMNLFIAIIPLLLLSAVFLQVTVIDMALPAGAEAQDASSAEPLDLTIRIRDDVYVVEAHGLPARSIPRHAGGRDAPVVDDPSAAALSAALGEIVAARPDNHDVRIVAAATTRYEEIIAVMDLARAAGLPQAALDGEGSEAF